MFRRSFGTISIISALGFRTTSAGFQKFMQAIYLNLLRLSGILTIRFKEQGLGVGLEASVV